MFATALATTAFVLALVPAILYAINSFLYRPPPRPSALSAVSILIPARNEERSIGTALDAALASTAVEFEIVVLDDHSDDRTGAIVSEFAGRDARVRLVKSDLLPDGWCGKQFACFQLARHARFPLLAFIDADVRLAPDGVARMVAFLEKSGAGLVSGIPRQETVTLPEKLVLPLAHFLLLGYLPFFFTRIFRHPAFAAGCGQLFVTRRDVYDAVGGHATIRGSRHDGLTLPRAYRRDRSGELPDVSEWPRTVVRIGQERTGRFGPSASHRALDDLALRRTSSARRFARLRLRAGDEGGHIRGGGGGVRSRGALPRQLPLSPTVARGRPASSRSAVAISDPVVCDGVCVVGPACGMEGTYRHNEIIRQA